MKAIIIGATSGIGEAMIKELIDNGYEVGITGRRTELLTKIQQDYQNKGKVHIQTMDVCQFDQSRTDFLELINRMGGLDMVIINAGVGSYSQKWESELSIIQTNVAGFCAIAHAAFQYFAEQKKGHIVGISSVAAVVGGAKSPAYNASKAFISSYMNGLLQKSIRKALNIHVTDIRPGFVKTPMTEQNRKMIWVASSEKAAKQIMSAIKRKQKIAYITKRWWIAAFIMRNLPNSVLAKMG